RLAERWRAGSVFLAGDAAHTMTPFLGQGGCSGLRDAINLAWKLDLVLRSEAGDGLLDTYESERKPHVRVHIEGSDRIGALAFIADPDAAAARDRAYLSGQAPPAPAEPVLTSGLLDAGGGPVGGLGPQGMVRHQGKEGRFDDVAGWGFQLLAWDCNPAEYLRPGQLEFLQRIGGVIAGISNRQAAGLTYDAEGAYQRFFSEHDVQGLLLRPDFVVFGVAPSAADLPGLVGRLQARLHI
ncbi:MAG TPA: FAD-dependent monooxygenase, partial [Dehalococcoidia bacterium]|nr:FAD-dependent monooxygenase [Dehalococcoidia bacterium]